MSWIRLEPGLDVRIVPVGSTLYLSRMPRDSTAFELQREAASVGPDHGARFAAELPPKR